MRFIQSGALWILCKWWIYGKFMYGPIESIRQNESLRALYIKLIIIFIHQINGRRRNEQKEKKNLINRTITRAGRERAKTTPYITLQWQLGNFSCRTVMYCPCAGV